MTRPVEEQSLVELLASLANSIPILLRDEFELLRAQAAFGLGRVQAAFVLLVVATALSIGAIILVVAALVSGLTIAFLNIGLAPAAAVSLAALVVAVIVGVIALALIAAARGQLQQVQTAIGRQTAAVEGGGDAERNEG